METRPADAERDAISAVLAVVAILLGLGLRVGYAVDRAAQPVLDAVAYARIAASLDRHGFRRPPPGREGTPAGQLTTPPACRSSSPASTSSAAASTNASPASSWRCSAPLHVPFTYLLGRRLSGPPRADRGRGVRDLPGAARVPGHADDRAPGRLPALRRARGIPLGGRRPLAVAVAGRRSAARGALAGATGVPGGRRPPAPGLAIREGLRRQFASRGDPGRGVAARNRRRPRALDDPQRGRTATAPCRSPPVAARRSSSAPTCDAEGDGPKLRELLLSERPALRERLSRGGPVDDPNRVRPRASAQPSRGRALPGPRNRHGTGANGPQEPRGRCHPGAGRVRENARGQGV